MLAVLAVAIAVLTAWTSPAESQGQTRERRPAADQFIAIATPAASVGPSWDFPATVAPAPTRATPEQPRAAVEAPKPTRKPVSRLVPPSRAVRGDATWYCLRGVSVCPKVHSGGMYAAAGPSIRVGHWRGRTVRVTYHGTSIRVTLVDWCACGGGRAIDLFSDAFKRLAPLSAGELHGVTVAW